MSKATKTKLFVFSLLLFSGILFNVQTAHAFFDVPFAIMGTQLDALDFIDSTLLRYMTFLAFLLVQSIVFILIAANFLGWAIAYPIGLGPENLLVNKGWEITNHLTNMFFILIFVAIAIAYILKLETFGMKKALPRLIIIALLTNFSLLFTRMIVDIGWVTQNAFFNIFFGGNQDFATTALKPLTDNLSEILRFLTADLAWFVGFALIPGLNVAKEAFLALWFFTMGGWGIISEAVVLTVFALSAGLIFLAYALFFLFRVAIIWILAILAPLAFAAYILTSTEKFFKQWLRTLIQWTFFGIAAFFLLGLGISLFGFIPKWPVPISFTGTQPWTLPGELAKFLFLLVYLIVAFGVARKTAPMGADALWNFSGMATKKFGQWSGSKMGAGLSRVQDRIGEKTQGWTGKTGEKFATVGTPKPGWGVGQRGPGAWFKRRGADVLSGAIAPVYGGIRAAGRSLGPEIKEARAKTMAAAEAEAEKFSSAGLLLSKLRDELAPGGSIDRAIGIASGGIKKGSVFKQTLQDKLTEAEKERLGVETNKRGVINIAERFGRSFIGQAENMGFGLKGGEITKKLIREATKDELKDFSKNFWLDSKGEINDSVMSAIQGTGGWGGPQLGKAADEFGRKFVDDFMSALKNVPVKRFIKENPKAALYLAGNTAQDLGYTSPAGWSSDEIKKELAGNTAPTPAQAKTKVIKPGSKEFEETEKELRGKLK